MLAPPLHDDDHENRGGDDYADQDENEVRKLHPDVQIFDYPADHGFHCDERGSYDAAASKQAMARTLEFFGKHVG